MKGIKIAVSGKGGAGKTTLAAALIQVYAETNRRVYAVDADPDASLAPALGLAEEAAKEIRPLVELKESMRELMGGEGEFFSLTPAVAEVLDDFCHKLGNILFIRMGELKKGATGCYCRENAFLHAVLTALLLDRDEVVVMDMPAGVEHLSRGTARGVDVLLIVTEPNRRSIHTGRLVEDLAGDLGVKRVAVIGNKIESAEEIALIEAAFPGKVIGMLPFDRAAYRGEGELGIELLAAVRRVKDLIERERVG